MPSTGGREHAGVAVDSLDPDSAVSVWPVIVVLDGSVAAVALVGVSVSLEVTGAVVEASVVPPAASSPPSPPPQPASAMRVQRAGNPGRRMSDGMNVHSIRAKRISQPAVKTICFAERSFPAGR
jgi:hypothetical protein